jgi:hypothetical protein
MRAAIEEGEVRRHLELGVAGHDDNSSFRRARCSGSRLASG